MSNGLYVISVAWIHPDILRPKPRRACGWGGGRGGTRMQAAARFCSTGDYNTDVTNETTGALDSDYRRRPRGRKPLDSHSGLGKQVANVDEGRAIRIVHNGEADA